MALHVGVARCDRSARARWSTTRRGHFRMLVLGCRDLERGHRHTTRQQEPPGLVNRLRRDGRRLGSGCQEACMLGGSVASPERNHASCFDAVLGGTQDATVFNRERSLGNIKMHGVSTNRNLCVMGIKTCALYNNDATVVGIYFPPSPSSSPVLILRPSFVVGPSCKWAKRLA